ncbi:MAG: hypothetical protein AAFP19_20775, partial [Bacteroidota bacterium]
PFSSPFTISILGISIGLYGLSAIILLFIGIPLWLQNEIKPIKLNEEAVSMVNKQYPDLSDNVVEVAIVDQWEKEIRRSRLLRFFGYGLLAIFLPAFTLGALISLASGFQLIVVLPTLLMILPIVLAVFWVLKAMEIKDKIIASYEKPADG